MKLIADVKSFPNRVTHGVGTIVDEVPRLIEEFPKASRVEIEDDCGGFYLIRYDENNEFAGDTWHETIETAKRQGQFEFGIADADWTRVS
jgi:hypothetical protein